MKNEDKSAAKEFDGWAKKGMADSMAAGHFPVGKIAIEKLPIDNKQIILDLSCGNGWAIKYFLHKKIKGGIATDISFEMLKTAKNNLSEYKNLLLLRSSVNNLPFKNNSFDIVFNMESFYYYKNPKKVLSEIYRILKKEGRLLLIVDFYKENRISMRWSERLNIYMNPLSITEYEIMLKNSGFIMDNTERIISPNIKTKEKFNPSDSIKTYEEYLEFKRAGSLSITALKK